MVMEMVHECMTRNEWMDGWMDNSASRWRMMLEKGDTSGVSRILFNIPNDKKVHYTGTKFSRNINYHDRSVQILWSHCA